MSFQNTSLYELPPDLVKKIESFPESGMLFWRLTVSLKNGSIVHGVICGHNGVEYGFLSEQGYLKKSDIVDVEWEGKGRPDWDK
jgi:hypothetical protein